MKKFRIRDNGFRYVVEVDHGPPYYFCGMLHDQWCMISAHRFLWVARVRLWYLRAEDGWLTYRAAKRLESKRPERILPH